jgi:hypothetical protein
MIRFVNPFIFANAFFDADDSIDYQAIGIPQPQESAPVRFHIESVMAWNQVSETQTMVRLATGSGYILDCEIDEFDQIMVANGSI